MNGEIENREQYGNRGHIRLGGHSADMRVW